MDRFEEKRTHEETHQIVKIVVLGEEGCRSKDLGEVDLRPVHGGDGHQIGVVLPDLHQIAHFDLEDLGKIRREVKREIKSSRERAGNSQHSFPDQRQRVIQRGSFGAPRKVRDSNRGNRRERRW